MGEMIFEGKVDESEVGKIKAGMDLILTVGAIENETFDAISRIHRAQRRGRKGRHSIRNQSQDEAEAEIFLQSRLQRQCRYRARPPG